MKFVVRGTAVWDSQLSGARDVFCRNDFWLCTRRSLKEGVNLGIIQVPVAVMVNSLDQRDDATLFANVVSEFDEQTPAVRSGYWKVQN